MSDNQSIPDHGPYATVSPKDCPKCNIPLVLYDGGFRGAYYYCPDGHGRWEVGDNCDRSVSDRAITTRMKRSEVISCFGCEHVIRENYHLFVGYECDLDPMRGNCNFTRLPDFCHLVKEGSV